jgi:hypothetical protein
MRGRLGGGEAVKNRGGKTREMTHPFAERLVRSFTPNVSSSSEYKFYKLDVKQNHRLCFAMCGASCRRTFQPL